jgi:hypothetical protein
MDAAAPLSREELLLALSSPDLREKLVHFAHERCHNGRNAKDFASQAIRYAIETQASNWNRARQPDLSRYLGSLVNRFVWAHRVRASTRREMRELPEKVDRKASSFASPEETLLGPEELKAERVRVERRIRALRDRLGREGNEISCCALLIIDLELDGTCDGADQAVALGVGPRAVDLAREHLAKCVDELLGAEGANASETRP